MSVYIYDATIMYLDIMNDLLADDDDLDPRDGRLVFEMSKNRTITGISDKYHVDY